MASASELRGFKKLPTEIKENVFVFIRLVRDRAAVSLVCREWRESMARDRWETLEVCIDESNRTPAILSGRMGTLLHPRSGILPYVRILKFLSTYEQTTAWGDEYEDILRMLIAALPKNTLVHFVTDRGISAQSLLLLLRNHQRLQSLSLAMNAQEDPVTPPETDLLANYSWMSLCLSELKCLRVCMAPRSSQRTWTINFENVRHILATSPKVKTLHIEDDAKEYTVERLPEDLFGHLPTDNTPPRVFQLEAVRLTHVDFEGQRSTLGNHIDFAVLKELSLERCTNVAPFLEGLVDVFSHSSCSLKVLHIWLREDRSNYPTAVQAVETLLNSFSGLTHLVAETTRGDLIKTAAIIRHGPSLKSLSVSCSRAQPLQHYSVSDLAFVLDFCPQLEQLALSCPLHLGPLENGATFELGSLKIKPDFDNMLGVIARYPKTHTLQFLSMPYVVQTFRSEHASLAQCLMQSFSTKSISYLAKHGSNIKVFAASPYSASFIGSDQGPQDANLHYWPHYVYTRGRMIDCAGFERVVAIPCRNRVTELPESTILDTTPW